MGSATRWTVLVLSAAVLGAVPLRAFDSAEPCLGVFMGASLSASLLDVSQTTVSLKLLNGREDPKLKRLLEWRLITAIGATRRFVDSGPVVDAVARPNLLPNWVNIIERAKAYTAAHHLDTNPPIASPPLQADDAALKPSENLQVIKAWLSKQASGAAH